MNLNMNATLDLDQATFGLGGRMSTYAQLPEASGVVLEIISALPKGHAELADQLLRASQSQPRNIAGAGRRTTVGQARFYTHARGSAMEAAAALDTMRVMKLVSETSYTRGIELLEGICDAHENDLISSTSRSKVALMFRFMSRSTSRFLSDWHWR